MCLWNYWLPAAARLNIRYLLNRNQTSECLTFRSTEAHRNLILPMDVSTCLFWQLISAIDPRKIREGSESWQDVKASVSKEVEACSLSGATVNQMRFEVIQDVFRTQGESLSYKLFVFYLSSSILGWRSERTFPTNIKCAFWVFLMFLFAGQIIIEECLPSIEGVKMNWSES